MRPDGWPGAPTSGAIMYSRWTPTARACYASSMACDNCQVFNVFNRRWLGSDATMYGNNGVQGCKMPMAVQTLLDAGKPAFPKHGNCKDDEE